MEKTRTVNIYVTAKLWRPGDQNYRWRPGDQNYSRYYQPATDEDIQKVDRFMYDFDRGDMVKPIRFKVEI